MAPSPNPESGIVFVVIIFVLCVLAKLSPEKKDDDHRK